MFPKESAIALETTSSLRMQLVLVNHHDAGGHRRAVLATDQIEQADVPARPGALEPAQPHRRAAHDHQARRVHEALAAPLGRRERLERLVMGALTGASVLVVLWLVVPGPSLGRKAASSRLGTLPKLSLPPPPPPSSAAYPVLGEMLPEAPIDEQGILVSLRVMDACGARIAQRGLDLLARLAHAKHQAGLRDQAGSSRKPKDMKRALVIGLGAHLAIQARHGLQVVPEHGRPGLAYLPHGGLVPAKVRHEHFDQNIRPV